MRVFDALKEGNKALDAIHQVMSVDKVEMLMDETAEAIAVQKEIDAMLTGEDIGVVRRWGLGCGAQGGG